MQIDIKEELKFDISFFKILHSVLTGSAIFYNALIKTESASLSTSIMFVGDAIQDEACFC
jgi:hypothetical protein